MKSLKNIFFGFIVSFLGSLPLGYLNIIGVEIYSKSGLNDLIPYLLGVIVVEAIVIYFTGIFANQLTSNKKLLQFIDFFAVFFFFSLAYLFYTNANQATEQQFNLEDYVRYSPFVIGMFLCGLNFIQIPFWLYWNLYLINAKAISLDKKLKYLYILGTLVGSFLGMLTIIVLLASLIQSTISFTKYIVPIVIPAFFVLLAFVQMVKVYKKYLRQL
jgi:hypothetical protein